MNNKAIALLEEEISLVKSCPDDCDKTDAFTHKAGLKQLLALLRDQKFAKHKKSCDIYRPGNNQCSCGFEKEK